MALLMSKHEQDQLSKRAKEVCQLLETQALNCHAVIYTTFFRLKQVTELAQNYMEMEQYNLRAEE